MENNIHYIIYAPSFNINSGGNIALHKLSNDLNNLGQSAFIYPFNNNFINFRIFNKFNSKIQEKNRKIPKNSIVIYPEIINGNPLNSKNIVRQLLNEPAKFTGRAEYGSFDKELFVYYEKSFTGKYKDNFDKVEKESGIKRQLLTTYIQRDIYKNENIPFNKRPFKYVYMLRKYEGQSYIHRNDQIKLDGKPHQEIAYILNRAKYFVSYDLYTMYSIYAVLCGCISIVVPSENVSKQEQQMHEGRKFGIAYGFDEKEITYAINTKNLLLNYINKKETYSIETVKNFINLSYNFFNIKK